MKTSGNKSTKIQRVWQADSQIYGYCVYSVLNLSGGKGKGKGMKSGLNMWKLSMGYII